MRRARRVTSIFAAVGFVSAGLAGVIAPTAASGAASPFAVDKQVFTHQTAPATSIASPTFTTAQANEVLVAFITSDGPTTAKQTFSTVTGGGLAWRLRQRANTQAGTAEIWQAVAATVLTNASVTATRSNGSYVGSITVTTFTGASTTLDGATISATGSTGAPSA